MRSKAAPNRMSARIPSTEAVRGYSQPFPSDCSLLPGVGSTMCASLSSRALRRFGERDCSRVLRGTSRPEATQLLTLAKLLDMLCASGVESPQW